jgi:hypothetical protein
MREVFHLPRAAKMNGHVEVHVEKHARPESHECGAVLPDAVRSALRHGAMGPGELASALKVNRALLRYHLRQLEADGVIVGTGNTSTPRYALAERSAKEEP